ncbi:6-bladed beta-propeller [Aestuariivivens sediminicola]|uniref:6-bladed beta-propeller n=1 Tax=Aestuariivivens sediminicola TaxID=2913560 RepID=UPI001F55E866|nr:6-bladed beta-propeller [Aestuariivivens sediminicola]
MKSFFTSLGLVIITILALNSCSPKIAANIKPKVYYPEIADSAKVQFLTYFSNSLSIENKQSKFSKAIIGDALPLSIKKAYGVEFFDNKIYVSDIGIKGMDIIDLESSRFKYFVPQGLGKLKTPVNACLDENGTLYVVDISEKKIMLYDNNSNYLGQFGKKENIAPSDIAVNGDKLWVCDSKNNRINVYNRNTQKFLYYLPKAEEGDDHWLYMPTNIHVSEDKIYVSDMGSGNVKIFSHKGEYIQSIGSFGTNMGQFIRPKGVAVDNEGNIYVVDASFHNVQIFNEEGELLLFFGGPTGDLGGMYLPTSIAIDYNVSKFIQYVDPNYDLKYLIFVINQFGPHKLNVYGRVELKKEI